MQENAPLPLLPNIMGLAEVTSRSMRRAVDVVDAASQRRTVRPASSWNTQRSDSDPLESPMRYMKNIPSGKVK
jgi:hypothetical protein